LFTRVVDRLEEGVISFLLVGMTLLVFVEVVMRFGFNTGFLWIQELTLHASAWFVLFGASYGVKVGAHIGVDAIVKMIPPGPRRWVSMVAVGLSLTYCGLFMYGGWVYLAKMLKIGIELEDLPIPRWIAHSILFIGFVLLAVRFIQLFFALATGRASGFQLADEAADVLKEMDGDHAGAERGGAEK
jgi:C4-dicarboxylate transporter, DctQ subunit